MPTWPRWRDPIPQRPLLVLVVGAPGTGKSTLARSIAARLEAVLINSDTLTEPMFPGERDSRAYIAMRPALYRAMYAMAAENLALGHPVLIDAPHLTSMHEPAWQAAIKSIAERAGAELRLIRCHCAPQIMRARLAARGEARDQPRLADWDRFLATLPPPRPLALPHLDLATDGPAEAALAAALAHLGVAGPAVE